MLLSALLCWSGVLPQKKGVSAALAGTILTRSTDKRCYSSQISRCPQEPWNPRHVPSTVHASIFTSPAKQGSQTTSPHGIGSGHHRGSPRLLVASSCKPTSGAWLRAVFWKNLSWSVRLYVGELATWEADSCNVLLLGARCQPLSCSRYATKLLYYGSTRSW